MVAITKLFKAVRLRNWSEITLVVHCGALEVVLVTVATTVAALMDK